MNGRPTPLTECGRRPGVQPAAATSDIEFRRHRRRYARAFEVYSANIDFARSPEIR
jgi:hypothetical protein